MLEFLSSDRIRFLPAGSGKESTLDLLVDDVLTTGAVVDRAQFAAEIRERESIMSTGIGFGIAIPHACSAAVEHTVLAVGISAAGIGDWESMDDKPVHYVIMIAARHDQHKEYLRLLAKLASVLKVESRREQLKSARTPAEVIDVLAGI